MRTHIKKFAIMIFLILSLFNLSTCKEVPNEYAVIEIGMQLPATEKSPEMSGLSWYEDFLVILPQFPDLFKSDHDGKLFAIPKTQILAYLDDIKNSNENKKQALPALEPQAIDFIIEKELFSKVKNFEGFESIAFRDNRVFITIEASPGQMLGYLASGEITRGSKNQLTITISGNLVSIQPQACISNAAYETLLVTEDRVIVIYEGNGVNVNASPLAYVYTHDLEFIHAVAFPNIEYRITDATAADENNRFWCINYFWPGEKDKAKFDPGEDNISMTYGKGKTHGKSEIVERLVEFEYISMDQNNYPGIVLVDSPPIQLELVGYDKSDARNWEGLVRLDNRGFLLVTDEFPRTMLGFIASNIHGDPLDE